MVKLFKTLTLALFACLSLTGCSKSSSLFPKTAEDMACADVSVNISKSVDDTLGMFDLKSERSFVRYCELVGPIEGGYHYGVILMGFEVMIDGNKKELGALGQFADAGGEWEILKGAIIYDVYSSAK